MTTEIVYRLKDMLSSVPDCQCETCLNNRATLAELDAQAAELETLRGVANTLLAGSETLATLDAREWKAKYGKEAKP